MNVSKSPVVTELEYIEPLCTVFESGSTTIISFAPWAKAPSMVCGHVDLVAPLLRADGIPMQGIDHG